MTSQIEYYDKNAEFFLNSTQNLDMTHIYKPFLEILGNNKNILDLGCGVGRDAEEFINMGHNVLGIDGSISMCQMSQKRLGNRAEIKHMMYEEIEWNKKFDGIWACASLVHLERCKMDQILSNLAKSIKEGGIFYMSVKYGENMREINGRIFYDWTEDMLRPMLLKNRFEVIKFWKTGDVRVEKPQIWLNALCKLIK